MTTHGSRSPLQPRMYRTEEVAELLACSRSQVYMLIRKGAIRHVTVGKSIRVPAAEIDRIALEGTGE